MRVLVIKLTSMGDVLHLLPALSDLQAAIPEVKVDWMVEDSFAEIPTWHSTVHRVIPVATRRWRSLNRQNMREFRQCVKHLKEQSYDVVVDAQGLMKSSGLARFAKLNKGGKRVGFSAASIKEKHAAWFYQQSFDIERQQHAIDRLRQLFAKAFAYSLPTSMPNYAIKLDNAKPSEQTEKTVVFLHGTTWPSKHLPDQRWRELRDLALADGYKISLTWGNETEKSRAEWIAESNPNVTVLAKSGLTELATILHAATGVIAVDTGLGHMAAALGVPAVSVYGATKATLTGAVGEAQYHLQSRYLCSPCFLKECNKLTAEITQPPCYDSLTATTIWNSLLQQIA